MTTAVVYYSMSGNTAFTARKIAEEIGAELIEIKPEKQYPDRGIRKFLYGGKSAVMGETPALLPYEFSGEKYGQIIFGFPVWAGNIAPPLRTFIRDHADELKGKKICAFACQGGSGAEKAFLKMAALLKTGSLAEQLILIDPKDKPNPDNEERIRDFCRRCRNINADEPIHGT